MQSKKSFYILKSVISKNINENGKMNDDVDLYIFNKKQSLPIFAKAELLRQELYILTQAVLLYIGSMISAYFAYDECCSLSVMDGLKCWQKNLIYIGIILISLITLLCFFVLPHIINWFRIHHQLNNEEFKKIKTSDKYKSCLKFHSHQEEEFSEISRIKAIFENILDENARNFCIPEMLEYEENEEKITIENSLENNANILKIFNKDKLSDKYQQSDKLGSYNKCCEHGFWSINKKTIKECLLQIKENFFKQKKRHIEINNDKAIGELIDEIERANEAKETAYKNMSDQVDNFFNNEIINTFLGKNNEIPNTVTANLRRRESQSSQYSTDNESNTSDAQSNRKTSLEYVSNEYLRGVHDIDQSNSKPRSRAGSSASQILDEIASKQESWPHNKGVLFSHINSPRNQNIKNLFICEFVKIFNTKNSAFKDDKQNINQSFNEIWDEAKEELVIEIIYILSSYNGEDKVKNKIKTLAVNLNNRYDALKSKQLSDNINNSDIVDRIGQERNLSLKRTSSVNSLNNKPIAYNFKKIPKSRALSYINLSNAVKENINNDRELLSSREPDKKNQILSNKFRLQDDFIVFDIMYIGEIKHYILSKVEDIIFYNSPISFIIETISSLFSKNVSAQ